MSVLITEKLLALALATLLLNPLVGFAFAQVSSDGIVDVHNDPPLGSFEESSINACPGSFGGQAETWSSTPGEAAFAQPFTPALPILTAVDIGLHVFAQEGANAKVEIRENSIGPVLGERQLYLPHGNQSYYHFSFFPRAVVTPGKQYLILLYGVKGSVHTCIVMLAVLTSKMWKGPYLLVRSYNGSIGDYDRPEFQYALAFRTYGLEKPPTSTTNTAMPIMLNGAYGYILAVVVLTVFAAYATLFLRKKRRRSQGRR